MQANAAVGGTANAYPIQVCLCVCVCVCICQAILQFEPSVGGAANACPIQRVVTRQNELWSTLVELIGNEEALAKQFGCSVVCRAKAWCFALGVKFEAFMASGKQRYRKESSRAIRKIDEVSSPNHRPKQNHTRKLGLRNIGGPRESRRNQCCQGRNHKARC